MGGLSFHGNMITKHLIVEGRVEVAPNPPDHGRVIITRLPGIRGCGSPPVGHRSAERDCPQRKAVLNSLASVGVSTSGVQAIARATASESGHVDIISICDTSRSILNTTGKPSLLGTFATCKTEASNLVLCPCDGVPGYIVVMSAEFLAAHGQLEVAPDFARIAIHDGPIERVLETHRSAVAPATHVLR